MQIAYYRYPKMNIVTIRAKHVPADIAERYGLVPDTHDGKTLWYKIVIMDHVEVEHLEEFLENLPSINV
jgi:hypothetical protein